MSQTTPLSRVRKTLFGIAVAAALLLLAEGLARLMVPAEKLRFSWESPDPLLVIDDQGGLIIAPYTSKEQADGPHHWVARTAIWGLREEQDPSPKRPPDTLRLLALGDSWMFGWNARAGYTVPDQLEALLPERLGVAKVEIVNGAIFGSCAFDMLRRWQQLSTLMELDGVLLGRPHNELRQSSLAKRRESWYAQVRGAPFIDLRLYLLARVQLARFMRPQFQYEAGNHDATTLADLRELMRDARARGKQVYFVGWPTSKVEGVPQRRTVMEPWEPMLAEFQVPHGGHLLLQDSCWGFEDPNHPSEVGYRAIAEVIADIITTGDSRSLQDTPDCDTIPGIAPGRGSY